MRNRDLFCIANLVRREASLDVKARPGSGQFGAWNADRLRVRLVCQASASDADSGMLQAKIKVSFFSLPYSWLVSRRDSLLAYENNNSISQ